MFKKVLVANRGEIACRIIKTLKKMNIIVVTIFSAIDSKSLHRELADESYQIGIDNTTANSYSNIEFIVEIAKKAGVEAIHPGYGLLSENFHFAQRVSEEGMIFIGPHFSLMERMSDKMSAKNAAAAAGVSVVPGFKGKIRDYMHALQIAEEIGYPVMLKAAAGGGGKGMRVVYDRSEMEFLYNMALQEAKKLYDNTTMLVEKFIENGRHIEMQILGDKFGNIVCLGDRECSIQRRNQKIIEETPSPFMNKNVRQRMIKECLQFAKKENYFSAGTIEFIVDKDCNFYFLEVNTRIQVEHRITEMVTGIDIVEQMILIAADQKLPFKQKDIKPTGHAFECRLCAEDPQNDFIPSSGMLSQFLLPEISEKQANILIDTGVGPGDIVSPFYDSMIAKVCTKAETRAEALQLMRQTLDRIFISGLVSNISFLSEILLHEKFISGDFSTKFIEEYYSEGFAAEKVDARCFHIPIFAILGHFLHENIQKANLQNFSDLKQNLGHNFVVMIDAEHFVKIEILNVDEQLTKWKLFFQNKEWQVSFGINYNDPFIKVLLYDTDKNIEEHFVFLQREKFYDYFVKCANMELSLKIFKESTAQFLHEIPLESFSDSNVNENEIISPITGLVSEVMIQEGDHVFRNEVLCVISAMKMENPIKIPRSATVVKVHIAKGDNVQKGDLLFEIE